MCIRDRRQPGAAGGPGQRGGGFDGGAEHGRGGAKPVSYTHLISGEGVPDNSLIGKSSPDWILYKNQAGETHAVRIEWNLYMPRFRIEKNSNTLIPNEESYTFSMRDFLGKNEVTVENQEAIVQLKWSGLFRQQSQSG